MKKIIEFLFVLMLLLTSCSETNYFVVNDDCYMTTTECVNPVTVLYSHPIYFFSPTIYRPYTYIYRPYFSYNYVLSFGGFTWYTYNPYYRYSFNIPYMNSYWYYGYYHNHHFRPYHYNHYHPLWHNNHNHGYHPNNYAFNHNVIGLDNNGHYSNNVNFGHRTNTGSSIGGRTSYVPRTNVQSSTQSLQNNKPSNVVRQIENQKPSSSQQFRTPVTQNKPNVIPTTKQPQTKPQSTIVRQQTNVITIPATTTRPSTQTTRQPSQQYYKHPSNTRANQNNNMPHTTRPSYNKEPSRTNYNSRSVSPSRVMQPQSIQNKTQNNNNIRR